MTAVHGLVYVFAPRANRITRTGHLLSDPVRSGLVVVGIILLHAAPCWEEGTSTLGSLILRLARAVPRFGEEASSFLCVTISHLFSSPWWIF